MKPSNCPLCKQPLEPDSTCQTQGCVARDKTFRLEYRYRQWIGEPDPPGFGTQFIYTADPSWLHEECLRLTRHGHKVLRVEKLVNSKWRRI